MASVALGFRAPRIQRGRAFTSHPGGGRPVLAVLSRGTEGAGASGRCAPRGLLILAGIARLAAALATDAPRGELRTLTCESLPACYGLSEYS